MRQQAIEGSSKRGGFEEEKKNPLNGHENRGTMPCPWRNHHRHYANCTRGQLFTTGFVCIIIFYKLPALPHL